MQAMKARQQKRERLRHSEHSQQTLPSSSTSRQHYFSQQEQDLLQGIELQAEKVSKLREMLSEQNPKFQMNLNANLDATEDRMYESNAFTKEINTTNPHSIVQRTLTQHQQQQLMETSESVPINYFEKYGITQTPLFKRYGSRKKTNSMHSLFQAQPLSHQFKLQQQLQQEESTPLQNSSRTSKSKSKQQQQEQQQQQIPIRKKKKSHLTEPAQQVQETNQIPHAIRISENELISEQNISQIDRLTTRQIIVNAEKSTMNSNPLTIQASSDRLKELLSKPPHDRTDLDCESIANEMLGETGDAFYIILQGSVTIYIDEPTEFKSFLQLKEVARLEQGDSFGEIALLYDSQRTATIISNERTYLIVLERGVFTSHIKEMKNEHLIRQMEFLNKIGLCAQLKPSHIMEMTTKLQMKMYTSNEIIGQEGDILPRVVFIKCGRAKVFRSIQFRINKYTRQKIRGDIKDPSPEEIAENLFATEMIEIDEISDYSVIGEYSLMYNKPLGFTVVTLIPTEAYIISAYDVIKIMPPDLLEKQRKLLKQYPHTVEIRQMYWEKRGWESFQQKVISNIHVEKENKKGFEQLLKKPTLKFASVAVPLNLVDIKSSDNSVYIDFLSARVPRGLQTKRNVTGLQHIQTSMGITKPFSSTAISMWEKLQETEGIKGITSTMSQRQLARVEENPNQSKNQVKREISTPSHNGNRKLVKYRSSVQL